MTGFLETQTSANQIEALYIAYFDRAGDNQGETYWIGQAAAGLSTVQIAQSFAVQPEAAALHVPTDPTNGTAVDTFIQNTYQNLFSRTADASGLAYWHTQITTGAVSLGAAVVAIANGAIGNDQTVLGFKIQEGVNFSDASQMTPAEMVQQPWYQAGAHNVVANVVDAHTASLAQGLIVELFDPGAPEIPAPLVGQSQPTTDMIHGA